ncbi:MAG: sulfur carrier protein ThiS [Acidobacteria bacterium]|nr:sulfur carrier protein ThiS [Acidobacteriota bacterium]
MTILVNGNPRVVPEGSTVTSLLRLLELPEGRIAVERNRGIIPRSLHSQTQLSEGDRIELVRFVGGG